MTINEIKQRIEWAKKAIARTEPIINAPQQIPGPFVTGRSGYTMGKKLDQENERRAAAFREYQKATKDLAFWEVRLKLIEAGEVHKNGQPRKDAPSRQRRDARQSLRMAFLRTVLKPGDLVALYGNLPAHTTVKKVNKKTITDTQGETWELSVVDVIDRTGGIADLSAAFAIWMTGRYVLAQVRWSAGCWNELRADFPHVRETAEQFAAAGLITFDPKMECRNGTEKEILYARITDAGLKQMTEQDAGDYLEALAAVLSKEKTN